MTTTIKDSRRIIDDYFSDWKVLQAFEEKMAAIKFSERVAEIVRLIKKLGIYDCRTLNANVDYVFDMAVPRFLHNNWI